MADARNSTEVNEGRSKDKTINTVFITIATDADVAIAIATTQAVSAALVTMAIVSHGRG